MPKIPENWVNSLVNSLFALGVMGLAGFVSLGFSTNSNANDGFSPIALTDPMCPDGGDLLADGRCSITACPEWSSVATVPTHPDQKITADYCGGMLCSDGKTIVPLLEPGSCPSIVTCPDGVTEVVAGEESKCPATKVCGPILDADGNQALNRFGEVLNYGNVIVRTDEPCPLPNPVNSNGEEALLPPFTVPVHGQLPPNICVNVFAEASRSADWANWDKEERNMCSFYKSNFYQANELGFTGRGITLGLYDDFVDTNHPELEGRPVGTIDVDNTPIPTVERGTRTVRFQIPQDDDPWHGTTTATLMVGKKDPDALRGLNIRGIAYEANLIARAPGPPGRVDIRVELIRELAAKAQIVTRSTLIAVTDGSGNLITVKEFEDSGRRRSSVGGLVPIAEAMAQADTHPKDRAIFVSPGGNAGGDDPLVDAAPTFWHEGLRGHHVTAIATDDVGIILTDPDTGRQVSNACGVVGDWCIAVPIHNTPIAINYFTYRNHVRLVNNNPSQTEDIFVWTGFFSFFGADGSTYELASGTSAAAPIVAGALALMTEAFGDQMTPQQILHRLYATADKSGRYSRTERIDAKYTVANDGEAGIFVSNPNVGGAIYGQGLIDMLAAVTPRGTTSIRSTLGSRGRFVHHAARFEIGESRISSGPAFGDALSRALGDREMMFFDSLHTGFRMPMSGIEYRAPTRTRNPLRILQDRMGDNGVGNGVGNNATGRAGDVLTQNGKNHALAISVGYDRPFHADTTSLSAAGTMSADGYASLVRDGYSVGLQMDLAHTHRLSAGIFTGRARDVGNFTYDRAPKDTYGAYVSYGKEGAAYQFNVDAGYIVEDEQILGAYPQGAFAHAGETLTVFGGVRAGYDFGNNWAGTLQAHIGRTTPDGLGRGRTGLHDISSITSSAWSAGIYRRSLLAEGDAFGLFVVQPLRIENGSAELTYATGRTRTEDPLLLEETLNLPLAPSARAVDVELLYQWGQFALTGGATLNARHERGKTDAYIAAQISQRF